MTHAQARGTTPDDGLIVASAPDPVLGPARGPVRDEVPGTPDDRATIESLRDEVARLTDLLTAQRQEIRRLRRDAVRDALTGLLNRRGLERVLDRSISFVSRYDSSVALIYVDLDDFKVVNDSLGHAAGDAALRHVAGVLGATLRASDIIGRIGGDEFVALLWKVDEDMARDMAGRVVEALKTSPFVHQGVRASLSASLGVSFLTPEDTAADVLSRADDDMYRAKARRGA